ncbi:hypothetical protein IPJ72_00635 [Candidatus Peregrinibacteria bacterium]|nr:MAG: hypothetical protein IPJ72_00635 [Candidatus Peregrinibacteria bacterium]
MLTKKIIKENLNFILFGASGDLAQLKLFPSLYELVWQKRMPAHYIIFGFARTQWTHAEFRDHVEKSVRTHLDHVDDDLLSELLAHVYYVSGSYDDGKSYEQLAAEIHRYQPDPSAKTLAYYAIPPTLFQSVTQQLGGMRTQFSGPFHIMIEKPFGQDRESASDLFQFILNYFDHDEVFLLDHYLGKSSVKSILPLRYYNSVLNFLLQGKEIANIQISALETLGVEERIGFFDQVGIVKDMIQSHLFQVLALLTMSMPVDEAVKNIRREKGNILAALRPDQRPGSLVLGQYKGYRDQPGVPPDSNTPTFAALRCYLDLLDWYRVPIYIRTGKRLSHKHTYVTIEFKKSIFQENTRAQPNRLVLELFPSEKFKSTWSINMEN